MWVPHPFPSLTVLDLLLQFIVIKNATYIYFAGKTPSQEILNFFPFQLFYVPEEVWEESMIIGDGGGE